MTNKLTEKYLIELDKILKGIDKTDGDDDDGWWETSTGANFGASIKIKLIAYIEQLLEERVKEALAGKSFEKIEVQTEMDIPKEMLDVIKAEARKCAIEECIETVKNMETIVILANQDTTRDYMNAYNIAYNKAIKDTIEQLQSLDSEVKLKSNESEKEQN